MWYLENRRFIVYNGYHMDDSYFDNNFENFKE